MFKGVDFFPHGTKWDVVGKRYIFVGLSWLLALVSLGMLATRGLNYGVDFKGGALVEVQSKAGAVDVAALRERLSKLGLGDVQVQGTTSATGKFGALIRVSQLKDEKEQAAGNDKIKASLGNGLDVIRTEIVGPIVSSELKRSGLWAVIVSLLGIFAYVWFRFEWQFAVAAIIALVHDVFITTGVFSLLGLEFDLTVVAALLTLAGYSINDTVVVFDRIRENLRKYKKMPLIDLMNLAINETLSRTVLTSVVTFLSVLALYLFGTEVIHGFSFAMLFGIAIGTYSSIFVAASLLIWLGVKREGWTGPTVAEKAAAAKRNA
jgi:preprotein translocase subunit SecF